MSTPARRPPPKQRRPQGPRPKRPPTPTDPRVERALIALGANPAEVPRVPRFHRVWHQAIVDILAAIERSPVPADRVVQRYFRTHPKLGARDHTVVSEAVYDVLRNRRRLIAQLEAHADATDENLAWAALLRADQWPDDVLPAAPDRIEAIRDALAHDPAPTAAGAERLAWRHSLPDWLAEALVTELGEERADTVAASLRERAPLVVRANTLRISRDALIERLAEEGVEAEPTSLSPAGLRFAKRLNFHANPAFRDGLYEVQDEGSQLIAALVDARPGQKIVDACAGAGGKTLALAASMDNRGMLYAFDNSPRRLEPLKLRARRAGAHNIRMAAVTGVSDARIERLRGEAHAVLVDAPCSGVGVLRRNPDAADRLTDAFLAELRQTQAALLHAWARAVRPGGRLVYATCSLLRAENEAIVDDFLAAHPDFHLAHANEELERHGIAADLDAPTMRLWPDRHTTDAFFAAVLIRDPTAA